MTDSGHTDPVRVAVIGSGPAGFYTVAALFKQREPTYEIDLFDRLPTPFGLVRAGVAPDHQKDKSVTRAFDKSARNPHFRFYGGVELGRHIRLDDLRRHYHQIVICTGAQTDRRLDIPGEDLLGSHSATEFVAWYNGHPDFAHLDFDLSQENVAVIGLGNVAVDVARILCTSHDELRRTDMADHALERIAGSRVRNVYLLGRRGPAQAAFSPTEIAELGALETADVTVRPAEARLDPQSRAWLEAAEAPNRVKNVKAIEGFAERPRRGRRRLLTIRFLVSPTEIVGNAGGHVTALRLARNEIVRADDGSLRAEPTPLIEELPVGLVFRSVGYRGTGFPDLPFDGGRAVIRNERGRIVDDQGRALPGLYVAGWIKRGPTGVIGTNKTDARETVACMVEDLAAGHTAGPQHPEVERAFALVRSRAEHVVSYSDWATIEAYERAMGERSGRPRVKVTSIAAMHGLLDRDGGAPTY